MRDVCRWRLCLVYHVGLIARRHCLGSSALMIYTIGIGIVRPGMALIAMDFLPQSRGLAASMQSFVQTIFFALCSALLVPLLFGNGALYDLAIAGFGLLTISLWLVAMNMRLHKSAQKQP